MSTGSDDSAGRPVRPRGAVVVCVIVTGHAAWVQSVLSVLAHTPPEVEIIVAGLDSAAVAEVVSRVPKRTAPVGAQPDCVDPAALAAGTADADVVFLNAPCVVADGWLDGLRAAAYSDATVASASAMVTADVPGAEDPFTGRAAGVVRAAVTPRWPRLAQPGGSCRYLRRSALELIDGQGPDFARACLEAGLGHALADDVLVASSAGHPEHSTRTRRAFGVARRALGDLSVIVDARNLDGPMDGTRVHVLELAGALARSGRAAITVLVPARVEAETTRALARVTPATLIPVAAREPPPADLSADVVHRPFQISAHADLMVLGQLADRLVITHQDLISYHNPAYFSSAEAWAGYRAMTERALGAADCTVFFSAHVRDEAVAEELVEPERASIVALGVDHVVSAEPTGGPATMPAGASALPDGEDVILCLGTDFRHKNRIFALRVVQALQEHHGWTGRLVLAGPRVRWGSSRTQEQTLRATDERLAAATIELEAVTEADKRWLLDRARLVLYPTVHEGFGLVPFEAAAHGRPCLWAAGTALGEILPEEAAGLVAWDARASADRALALMRDPERAAANIGAITAAAAGLRWDETAARLIDLYHAVCDGPPSPAARLERDGGLMTGGVSDDALRLVGPGGALPRDLERPLLALATHRTIGRPVLGAIRAGYRASLRWRRRGV